MIISGFHSLRLDLNSGVVSSVILKKLGSKRGEAIYGGYNLVISHVTWTRQRDVIVYTGQSTIVHDYIILKYRILYRTTTQE